MIWLLAGTYSNLPASIQDLRGSRSLPEEQQQRLISHLNHLLYSQLLKVCVIVPLYNQYALKLQHLVCSACYS